MVRSYLRHGPVEAFGVVASNTSNAVFDGKLAFVPANEDILVCEQAAYLPQTRTGAHPNATQGT
jgi:hypothetical protein